MAEKPKVVKPKMVMGHNPAAAALANVLGGAGGFANRRHKAQVRPSSIRHFLSRRGWPSQHVLRDGQRRASNRSPVAALKNGGR